MAAWSAIRTLGSWALLLAPAVTVYLLVPGPDVARAEWALGTLVLTLLLGNLASAVYRTRKQST